MNNIDQIINQVDTYVSDSDGAERLKSFVQDSVNRVKRNKLMVIHGNGSSGKSTFISVLMKFLKEKAAPLPYSSISKNTAIIHDASFPIIQDVHLVVFQHELGKPVRSAIVKSLVRDQYICVRPRCQNPRMIENKSNYILVCLTPDLDILNGLNGYYETVEFDHMF